MLEQKRILSKIENMIEDNNVRIDQIEGKRRVRSDSWRRKNNLEE